MNAVKILNVIDVIERNSGFNWSIKGYNFDTKGNLIFQFKENSLQDDYDFKLEKIPKEQYAIRETIKEVCFVPMFSAVYDDAIIFAKNIKVFNKENWRLPTYDELRMLDLYFEGGINRQIDVELLYWTTSDVMSNKMNKRSIDSDGNYFEMWNTAKDGGSILLVR